MERQRSFLLFSCICLISYPRFRCRFLSDLAAHRFFSEHHLVKSYLTSNDLSSITREREKLASGNVWSQLTKVYNDYQLGKIQVGMAFVLFISYPLYFIIIFVVLWQDPDDDLDSFFKYVCSVIPNLKTCYEVYAQSMIYTSYDYSVGVIMN